MEEKTLLYMIEIKQSKILKKKFNIHMKKFIKFSEGTEETEIDFLNRQYYTQC